MIQKTFLITGASTGIGEACAVKLARSGHLVLAGVRKNTDAERLSCEGGGLIVPVVLDVTSKESVSGAFGSVVGILNERKKEGLDGLVNNAGVVIAGSLEFIDLDAVRHQMEVNVIGLLCVTQTFMPLIRQAKGRIINMGSLSGLAAVPFVGPYTASKFALRGLTDCLRMELSPWKIPVSLIEPGPIATPIWEKSKQTSIALMKETSPLFEKYYGAILAKFMKVLEKEIATAAPVDVVVRAVEHACTANHPKLYYPVGKAAKLRAALSHLVPQSIMDKVITKSVGIS